MSVAPDEIHCRHCGRRRRPPSRRGWLYTQWPCARCQPSVCDIVEESLERQADQYTEDCETARLENEEKQDE